MARSAYGAGTLQHLGGDKWRLFASNGTDPITGKHRRASRTVHAPNKKAAQKLLGAFVAEAHGTRTAATLAALLDEYLTHKADMSPSTRADFETYIKRSIPAPLAKKRVSALTTKDLDGLYLHLLEHGSATGGPLAPATVRRVHVIIRAALGLAVRWGYITVNPADLAQPPKVSQTEVELPPADHLVRLLAHLDTLPADGPGLGVPPLPDFVGLLLATGARPGELCALPWGDVDLEHGRVKIDQNLARAKGGTVIKETKTRKGRRIALPQAVVDLLSARQARWKEASLRAGVPLADLPVFPSVKRADWPWRPDSISREFRTVRDHLNLSEDLTMRNLRHYCVTVLAAGGVDVVTAARRMGHSPNVMLDVYAHVLDASDREAAELLGAHIASVRRG